MAEEPTVVQVEAGEPCMVAEIMAVDMEDDTTVVGEVMVLRVDEKGPGATKGREEQ